MQIKPNRQNHQKIMGTIVSTKLGFTLDGTYQKILKDLKKLKVINFKQKQFILSELIIAKKSLEGHRIKVEAKFDQFIISLKKA